MPSTVQRGVQYREYCVLLLQVLYWHPLAMVRTPYAPHTLIDGRDRLVGPLQPLTICVPQQLYLLQNRSGL